MVVDGSASVLLQDPLNQRIIRQLVASELSVRKVSKMLDQPPLKVWRRIQSLRARGLVEESRVVHVRNLEVKMYRATAARYVLRGSMDYEPKGETLKQAYGLFSSIQSEIMGVLRGYDPIPSDADPIDFCVATDLYAYAKLLTREDVQRKLKSMLRLLEESAYAGVLFNTRVEQIGR